MEYSVDNGETFQTEQLTSPVCVEEWYDASCAGCRGRAISPDLADLDSLLQSDANVYN